MGSEPTKRCPGCKLTLPLSEFHRNTVKKDGLTVHCKECNRKRNLAWFHSHSEHCRANHARWKKNNADRDAASTAARKARKLRAVPLWEKDTISDVVARMYREAKRLGDLTGEPHHVDHVVPLKGRNVSGLHCEANLRVMPGRENCSKGNRWDSSVDSQAW